MNREMYESVKTQVNVENIAVDRIKSTSSNSQVRQAGERRAHVDALAEEIEARGQEIPITVEILPKNSDGTSQYEVVEGNHRLAAFKHLRKTTGDTRYATIKAVIKSFNDGYQRLKYQIEANNHTGVALKGSVDDAMALLKSFVFGKKPISGAPPIIRRLHGSASLNVRNPEAYKTMLTKAVKSLWPDYNSKKRNRIVTRFLLDPKLPGKFASFDTKSARIQFHDWAEAEAEDEVLGAVTTDAQGLYSILPIKNDNWIDHSLMGLAFREKTESRSGHHHRNIAVIFWKDIAGKTFGELDEHRKKMISKINKRNQSPILKRGVKMIDAIYIAPQKRDGCDEKGFYKVPLTSRGQFSTKQIPDSGWNTETSDSSTIAA